MSDAEVAPRIQLDNYAFFVGERGYAKSDQISIRPFLPNVVGLE